MLSILLIFIFHIQRKVETIFSSYITLILPPLVMSTWQRGNRSLCLQAYLADIVKTADENLLLFLSVTMRSTNI